MDGMADRAVHLRLPVRGSHITPRFTGVAAETSTGLVLQTVRFLEGENCANASTFVHVLVRSLVAGHAVIKAAMGFHLERTGHYFMALKTRGRIGLLRSRKRSRRQHTGQKRNP